MNKKIDFPVYFSQTSKFRTLHLNQEIFVNYVHNFDYIQNTQLSIHCSFLLFVFEGQVKLICEDGEWRVNEQEAAIINKGSYIMSESLSDTDKNFKAFLFFISDDLVQDFSAKKDISICKGFIRPHLVAPIDSSKSLVSYVNSVVSIMEESDDNDDDLIKLKGLELLHYLFKNNPDKMCFLMEHKMSDEKSFIQKTMEKNFQKSLSLDELAFLCGMSVSNFKRKFKKYFATSPAKWIKEKK